MVAFFWCPARRGSYLLVRRAVDLGAHEAAGGGGVEQLSPARQQVIAGGVTSPPGAVSLGL